MAQRLVATVMLAGLADFFAGSPEFIAIYGVLDNTQYVTLLYQNGLSVRAEATVYQEPDPAWRILGLLEWGRALGLFAP